MLAFIDYNSHLGRPQLQQADSSLVFVARFGKRTKQWYAAPVPCAKTYSYIPSSAFYPYLITETCIILFHVNLFY